MIDVQHAWPKLQSGRRVGHGQGTEMPSCLLAYSLARLLACLLLCFAALAASVTRARARKR
eukprot:4924046-Pleurochrysis_carterae.AAC.1